MMPNELKFFTLYKTDLTSVFEAKFCSVVKRFFELFRCLFFYFILFYLLLLLPNFHAVVEKSTENCSVDVANLLNADLNFQPIM